MIQQKKNTANCWKVFKELVRTFLLRYEQQICDGKHSLRGNKWYNIYVQKTIFSPSNFTGIASVVLEFGAYEMYKELFCDI